MVNCNPETVSTDYDTSDWLYLEPLTCEDIEKILDAEDPAGLIVLFRPSYVLSGRAMRVVHNAGEMRLAVAELGRGLDFARQ